MLLNKLVNFYLPFGFYCFFLIDQHLDGFLVLVRVTILFDALDRLVYVGAPLFVFLLDLFLLDDFVFSLLLDELVDGVLFLLLERLEFLFAIVEQLLDLGVQVVMVQCLLLSQ